MDYDNSGTLPFRDEMSTFQIVCKIWQWIITIFMNFAITLMLFPAIAVLVESTGKGSVRVSKARFQTLKAEIIQKGHLSEYLENNGS